MCGFIYVSRWVKLDKFSGAVIPVRKLKEIPRD